MAQEIPAGDATVRLKVDSQPAKKGAEKAGTQFSKLGKTISGVGSITAQVMAGLAKWASRNIQLARQLAKEYDKVAKNLGLTAQEVSELDLVGKLNDTDIKSFAGALESLRREIAQVENGNQAAADSFKQLGLDAKELSKLKLDAQLVKVGKALSQIEDKGQRDILGQALLGGDYAKLRPFLGDLESQLQKIQGQGLGLNGGRAAQSQRDLEELSALFDRRVEQASNRFNRDVTAPLANKTLNAFKFLDRVIVQEQILGGRSKPRRIDTGEPIGEQVSAQEIARRRAQQKLDEASRKRLMALQDEIDALEGARTAGEIRRDELIRDGVRVPDAVQAGTLIDEAEAIKEEQAAAEAKQAAQEALSAVDLPALERVITAATATLTGGGFFTFGGGKQLEQEQLDELRDANGKLGRINRQLANAPVLRTGAIGN